MKNTPLATNQPSRLPIQTEIFVFVYGTLKQGHTRNHVLADQTFIGEATTTTDYRMYDLGNYPGLREVAPGSGVQVQGEIYRIDQACLRLLDQIEAVDEGIYARREIRLQLRSNSKLMAEARLTLDHSIVAYFYLGDTSGCNDSDDY